MNGTAIAFIVVFVLGIMCGVCTILKDKESKDEILSFPDMWGAIMGLTIALLFLAFFWSSDINEWHKKENYKQANLISEIERRVAEFRNSSQELKSMVEKLERENSQLAKENDQLERENGNLVERNVKYSWQYEQLKEKQAQYQELGGRLKEWEDHLSQLTTQLNTENEKAKIP